MRAALELAGEATRAALANLLRALWTTPLFQARLEAPAPRLFLYGGMPYVTERWLGGMLTNWATIHARVQELDRLEALRVD